MMVEIPAGGEQVEVCDTEEVVAQGLTTTLSQRLTTQAAHRFSTGHSLSYWTNQRIPERR